MSDEPLTCPFCNALLLEQRTAADQRLLCHRCDATFTIRGDGIQRAPQIQTAPPPSTPPAKPRKRLTLFTTLGVMVLMAAVSLTYALYTQNERRINDRDLRRTRPHHVLPENPGSHVVLPAELDTIGYLPSQTNLVLGIHLAQIRESKEGRRLLEETIQIGKQRWRLATLFGSLGIPVEQLEHVVIGVRTDNLRVAIVVRASKPINRLDVQNKLDAVERPGVNKNQTVYRFQLGRLAADAKLWFADDTTLVIVPFGDVPEQRLDGLGHLAPAVLDALKQRLDPGSTLWFVGSVSECLKADWFKAVQAFSDVVNADLLDHLKLMNVAALGVETVPEVKITGAVNGQDAAAVQKLKTWLEGEGRKIEVDHDWLTVQWKGSLNSILKALR